MKRTTITNWGKKGMDQALRILENKTFTGTSIIATIAVFFWLHAWAGDTFVKREEFIPLIEESRLDNASQTIRALKIHLLLAQNSEDSTEVERLREDLERAKAYEDCLVRRQPNCQHLKVR